MSSDKYILNDSISTDAYGSLTVRSVTLNDAGFYNCTVFNVHETQTALALLQVQCKQLLFEILHL